MKTFQIALEEEHLEDGMPVFLDTVNDDVVDMNTASDSVDEAAEFICDADEAVVALEALAETLKSYGTEKFDPVTARLTQLNIESIYARAKLKAPRSMAMEAGESVSLGDRVNSLKAGARKLIEAILNALKQAWQRLVEFWNKATNAAGRMEKYALGVRKQLRSLQGVPSATTYSSASLGKALYTEDGSIGETYARVQKLTAAAAQSAYGQHIQLLNKGLDDFMAKRDTKGLIDKVVTAISSVMDGVVPASGGAQIDAPAQPEGTELHTTSYLLGGYVGALVFPTEAKALRHLQFAIQRPEDLDFKAEVQAAGIKEMEDLVNKAIVTCSVIRHFERDQKRLAELNVKVSKALDYAKSATTSDADVQEFLKTLSSTAPWIARGVHQTVFAYSLASTQAVLKHVEQSMKLFNAQPVRAEAV